MKNTITDRPLYSLTVGEYLELHKSLLNDLALLTPNVANPPKELLTIQEAAEFLQLSVATLYTMNCRKRVPYIKITGKIFYRRTALLLWLDSGERKTTAQLRKETEEGK